MKMITLAISAAVVSLGVLLWAGVGAFEAQPPGSRERFAQWLGIGNYKDAYEGYRALALDPKTDPSRVGTDLQQAVHCLIKLGRVDEIDDFREAAISVHKENWRLLQAAARAIWTQSEHDGFMVAGKFHRGQHRGGGRYVSSYERDRARALQLVAQGLKLARGDADREAKGRLLLTLAQAAIGDRAEKDSWRLQSLTPLETLPDYDENTSYGVGISKCRRTRGSRRNAGLLPCSAKL